MQWVTDKTAGIFADVAMLTMALACICLIFSITLDWAEKVLDEISRTIRQRRAEKGAVLVEFALLLPVMLMLIVGGALLQIALVDYGRLHFSVQESARAGASVLLTVDSSGSVTRHESEARFMAVSVFDANRPGGSDDAVIAVNSTTVEVSSKKAVDFLGFLPAREIEARSTSIAIPVFCP